MFYEGFYDEVRQISIYANTLYWFNPVTEVCSMLAVSNWKRVSSSGGGYSVRPMVPENDNSPTPCDRHTYNQFCYSAYDTSVYIYAGANQAAVINGVSGHPGDVWRYSLNQNKWIRVAEYYPGYTPGQWNPLMHDKPYFYNPLAEEMLFFKSASDIKVFNMTDSTWSQKPIPANTTGIDFFGSGNDYDAKRKRMILFGGYWSHPSNAMRYYYPEQNSYEVVNVSGPKPPVPPDEPHPPYSNLAVLPSLDRYLTVELGQTWVFDPNSNSWSQVTTSGTAPPDIGMYMAYDKGNNVIVCFDGSGPDFYVMRYDSGTNAVEKGRGNRELEISVNPNPFNTATRIAVRGPASANLRVRIYDISGELIKEYVKILVDPRHGSRESFVWDASGLPCGVYIIKAKTGQRTYRRKLVLQR
jgi:hypothetical protein